MTTKYFIFHILLVTCFTLILIKCFHYINSLIDKSPDFGSSSVWCNGLNHTQRRCRFKNLCFKKDTNDYIFSLDHQMSVISGIPSDRFSPALLDLSSVSDHNQYYFNYVEIPFHVLQNNLSKIYKIKKIKGKTLIFGRFKPDNVMHLFHDDLIPLYFTLQEIGFKEVENLFFDDIWPQVLNTSQHFSQFIYNSFFDRILSRDQMKDNTIYCFDEAFVGLTKSMTWYQYGFRIPQSPILRSSDESLLISNTIRRLTLDLIPETKCSTNYVVFISRKSTRKILNEKNLLNLISKITKLPIITLMIEDLSIDFEEMIGKVYCAKLMIGMHGSALILSIFLQSGSSLIELFPFAINPNFLTPFKTLTQLNGMDINYFWWKNQIEKNTFTHMEYPPEWGGIEHLSNEEKTKITSNSNDVPKHLCCSDKYWLYRIYSDTIVDINALKPILENAFHLSLHYKIPNPKQLASSHVIDLDCSRTSKDDTIYITIVWEKPWNLIYLKALNTKILYEILVQEIYSNYANSSLSPEREYTLIAKPEKSYNIWIRCRINEMNGPFNINPLIC